MITKIDTKTGRKKVIIFSGELAVCSEDELLETSVGGCIALCLYSKVQKVGGMNHFMLPWARSSTDQHKAQSNVYGVNAVSALFECFYKRISSSKDIVAYIFGSSDRVSGADISNNITLVKLMVEAEDVPIKRIDVGGFAARKIIFDTRTGKTYMRKMDTIQEEE